ncbi:hypothetical protein JRO89_XS03G0191800 [Xanthoceras sorbifolium]|uniref:Ankyrin repeat-containing protein n=1 Tax=Xanthoceras sorbifolium TaxID=99658 RepID=A0ABQ8IAL5_9ROSI|nr:hypothetical protein JRO89_XS03G0191800 [Xanthoceras sorbifolium]
MEEIGAYFYLHKAAFKGARQDAFVEDIIKLMEPEDLELLAQDSNNAFCFAVVTSIEIAKMMLAKNPNLLILKEDQLELAVTHDVQNDIVLHVLVRNHSSMFARSSIGILKMLTYSTRQVVFVKDIIKLIEPEDLKLLAQDENNAFCFDAATGTIEIAKMILAKNPNLLIRKGAKNIALLYMVALFGRREMTKFLYDESKSDFSFLTLQD